MYAIRSYYGNWRSRRGRRRQGAMPLTAVSPSAPPCSRRTGPFSPPVTSKTPPSACRSAPSGRRCSAPCPRGAGGWWPSSSIRRRRCRRPPAAPACRCSSNSPPGRRSAVYAIRMRFCRQISRRSCRSASARSGFPESKREGGGHGWRGREIPHRLRALRPGFRPARGGPALRRSGPVPAHRLYHGGGPPGENPFREAWPEQLPGFPGQRPSPSGGDQRHGRAVTEHRGQ